MLSPRSITRKEDKEKKRKMFRPFCSIKIIILKQKVSGGGILVEAERIKPKAVREPV